MSLVRKLTLPCAIGGLLLIAWIAYHYHDLDFKGELDGIYRTPTPRDE